MKSSINNIHNIPRVHTVGIFMHKDIFMTGIVINIMEYIMHLGERVETETKWFYQ